MSPGTSALPLPLPLASVQPRWLFSAAFSDTAIFDPREGVDTIHCCRSSIHRCKWPVIASPTSSQVAPPFPKLCTITSAAPVLGSCSALCRGKTETCQTKLFACLAFMVVSAPQRHLCLPYPSVDLNPSRLPTLAYRPIFFP